MTVIDPGFDPDPYVAVYKLIFGSIGGLAAVWAMVVMSREQFRYIDIQRAAVGILGGMLVFSAFDGDVMIGSHRLSALLTLLMITVCLVIVAWRGSLMHGREVDHE